MGGLHGGAVFLRRTVFAALGLVFFKNEDKNGRFVWGELLLRYLSVYRYNAWVKKICVRGKYDKT